jgi:hypothetical protein
LTPYPRGCVTVKRNGVVPVGSQGPAHALNISNRAPLNVREAGRINLAKYTSQRPPQNSGTYIFTAHLGV